VVHREKEANEKGREGLYGIGIVKIGGKKTAEKVSTIDE